MGSSQLKRSETLTDEKLLPDLKNVPVRIWTLPVAAIWSECEAALWEAAKSPLNLWFVLVERSKVTCLLKEIQLVQFWRDYQWIKMKKNNQTGRCRTARLIWFHFYSSRVHFFFCCRFQDWFIVYFFYIFS